MHTWCRKQALALCLIEFSSIASLALSTTSARSSNASWVLGGFECRICGQALGLVAVCPTRARWTPERSMSLSIQLRGVASIIQSKLGCDLGALASCGWEHLAHLFGCWPALVVLVTRQSGPELRAVLGQCRLCGRATHYRWVLLSGRPALVDLSGCATQQSKARH